MKKFFAMAAIALFTMVSCSDDDTAPTNDPATGVVLLKKIIETSEDGTNTEIYSYDGTKLTGITHSDGRYETITYVADHIVSWNIYAANDELIEGNTFNYSLTNINRLASSTMTYNGITTTRTYTYNQDGSISFVDSNNNSSGIIYNDKVKLVVATVAPQPEIVTWLGFEFDDKNNPHKNITGYELIDFALGTKPLAFGHNITKNTDLNADGTVDDVIDSSVFTYTTAGYPATEQYTSTDYNASYQYFYE